MTISDIATTILFSLLMIKRIITIFPAVESNGVALSEDPTVPNAEIHSKTIAISGSSGLTILVMRIDPISTNIDITIVAFARCTEFCVISLL